MSQRGVAFATAPRRLRGAVAATSLRRLHEPFIRSLRGPSRWVPRKTRNPFEPRRTIFQRLVRVVVEPRMQLLGLCSFDARRKSRFLVLGPKKRRFFGAPKKKNAAEKYFWGVEKVIWLPNTITRRRRKKKKPRFFRLGAEKYCSLGARRKSRFLVLGAEKTKKPPKKKIGGRKKIGGAKFFFGGGRKSYLAAEHHYETASKKKKKKSAWAPKNTTLGRLRSKGLATFFRGLREPFSDEVHRFSGTASPR